MAERKVLGFAEPVILLGNDEKEENVIARIDTGATSSSIDINLAKKLNIGPIIRSKIVKSASGIRKRPMVKAKVNLNGTLIEEEFTLADRSHLTYQMLIGQNILKKGKFLIDPLKE